MTKILIICGPTATGKTALAAKLAKKFKRELISADSRQVYQGMDIVTGKDHPGGVKIHGLDLVKPDEEFSVAHFVKIARTLINQIRLKKKLPIIVGGTGLYINSLVNPPQTLAVKPDWQLRQALAEKSVSELQEQLKKINPARFSSMNHSDQLNPRRLIRAIEVGELHGSSRKSGDDVLWIGLRPKNLEERIKIRLDKRLKQGMVKEVGELHRQGVSWKRLDDLGLEYRQISRYLKTQSKKGKLAVKSPKDFRNSEYYNVLLREIIKYSKRQITWFKRNKEIKWIKNLKQARGLVKKFLYSAARTIER